MKRSKILALSLALGFVFCGQSYAVEENSSSVEHQEAMDVANDYDKAVAEYYENQIKAEETKKAEEAKKAQEAKAKMEAEIAKNESEGYSTEEEAKAAAKEALKTSPINKTFSISKNDAGKFFFVLSASEDLSNVKMPEEEKEKPYAKFDSKADEKSFNFDLGFKTEKEAIQQAEALVKNSAINKGYNVTVGADGRYYIQLSPLAEKTKGLERKSIAPSKASNNVKTGVAGLTGVVATLVASSVAFVKTKRR